MAWTFTDLRYGWKIAAGIVLAGTTIYVATNTRQRVNQADIIELALGVHERCLATQYANSPVAYRVAPPAFVRLRYSNSYETTNVPGEAVTNWTARLWTNTFTNVIGFRTDREMMVELDAKIKALVPWYLNATSAVHRSTNLIALTVTGLWASLEIGDRTNLFTCEPEWVDTNGVTHAATYGEYPNRIYVEDLQERYKVLYSLRCTYPAISGISTGWYDVPDWGGYAPWDAAKSHSEDMFTNDASWSTALMECFTDGIMVTNKTSPTYYLSHIRTFRLKINRASLFLNTDVSNAIYFNLKATLPESILSSIPTNGALFDDNGLGVYLDTWTVITNELFGLPWGVKPTWCVEPTGISPVGYIDDQKIHQQSRGFQITAANQKAIADWKFLYCTNRFW